MLLWNTMKDIIERYSQKASVLLKTDVKYLLHSGFWLNLNFISGSGLSFILSILFAHFLSKDVFGVYKYILSIVGIAAAFSLTGMNSAVTRAVAQGFEGTFKKSIIEQIRWSAGQFLFTFVLSIYYFIQGNLLYGWIFLIVSILTPVSSIANTYSAYLQGKKDFKTSTIYGIWSNLFYFAVMAVAIIYTPYVFVMVILYYLIKAITNTYFCWKTFKKYKPNENYRSEDLTFGKHLSLMNILSIISSQIDNVIVYHFIGPASLALYSFAIIMPDRIRLMFGFISTAAFPKLAEKDNNSHKIHTNKKIIQLIVLALVISVSYILISPYIFTWFFPQYLPSIIYSQVFSLSLVVIATNISITSLFAQKSQKELYVMNIVTSIIRIIITAVGVVFFGLWGAIISRMIHYFLTLGLSIFFVQKK